MNTILMLWLTIISIGVATFGMRLSFVLLTERLNLPQQWQRALRFVPAAALTAMIVPELVLLQGTMRFAPDNPRLLAGILAIIVAWWTRNVFLTITTGMISLWVLQAFL